MQAEPSVIYSTFENAVLPRLSMLLCRFLVQVREGNRHTSDTALHIDATRIRVNPSPTLLLPGSHTLTVIGPIVGGFVAENPHLGWRFNFWLMFIFSVVSLLAGYFITPETVRAFFFTHSFSLMIYTRSTPPSFCDAAQTNCGKRQIKPFISSRFTIGTNPNP